MVAYGRLPYMKYLSSLQPVDEEIIRWAMEVCGILPYENTLVSQLSGGQQQRVYIAMALAQKSNILLLDEPTTYLDVKYQIEILNLIQKINQEYKMTIIMVHPMLIKQSIIVIILLR